jgi:hypothetical protein
MAVIAAVWTAAAMVVRSDGVAAVTLLLPGAGAVVVMVTVLGAIRFVARARLRELDEENEALAAATATDAIRALVGGVALALALLAAVWLKAVPGPFQEASRLAPVVWIAGVGLSVVLTRYAVTRQPRAMARWIAYVVDVARGCMRAA